MNPIGSPVVVEDLRIHHTPEKQFTSLKLGLLPSIRDANNRKQHICWGRAITSSCLFGVTLRRQRASKVCIGVSKYSLEARYECPVCSAKVRENKLRLHIQTCCPEHYHYIVSSFGWLDATEAHRILATLEEGLADGVLADRFVLGLGVEAIASKFNVTKERVLSICRRSSRSTPLIPDSEPLQVIFEDEYLLVVDKPCGLPMQSPHRFQGGSLRNRCIGYLGSNSTKEPLVVHRLDQDTSGVVVLAKDSLTAANLCQQFREKTIEKVYFAICDGIPSSNQPIEKPIARDPENKMRRLCSQDGNEAVTLIDTLSCIKPSPVCPFGASIVLAQPLTGRTHQIRLHLKSIGCPIVGDVFYGRHAGGSSPSQPVAKRLALHACSLQLQHPRTRELMQFRSPIPLDLVSISQEMGFEQSEAFISHLWPDKIVNEVDIFASKKLLSQEDLETFAKNGYLIVPEAVPSDLWHPAAAFVLSELGMPGQVVAGANTENSGFDSIGKLRGSDAQEFRDLLQHKNSKLGDCVAQMLGEETIDTAVENQFGCQIALRFPDPALRTQTGAKRLTLSEIQWHIDGCHTRQCRQHPFSLLVGVALTDCGNRQQGQDESLAGNLCVWPGSHLDLSKEPSKRICEGPRDAFDAQALIESGAYLGGYEGLSAGDQRSNAPSPGFGARPTALQLQAGDAVILHPDLAHAAAPNYCPNVIRGMVYFRLKHKKLFREAKENKANEVFFDLPAVASVVSRKLGEHLD